MLKYCLRCRQSTPSHFPDTNGGNVGAGYDRIVGGADAVSGSNVACGIAAIAGTIDAVNARPLLILVRRVAN